MSNAIPIHGTCEPRFAKVRELFQRSFDSGHGYGTARALARIYGALARGGVIDGVQILEPRTIAAATTEEAAGPEHMFCGAVPMRFGLGFTMNNMQSGIVSAGSTPTVLIDAFYDAL